METSRVPTTNPKIQTSNGHAGPQIVSQFPINDGWGCTIVCLHPEVSSAHFQRFLQQSGIDGDRELGRFERDQKCYVVFETRLSAQPADQSAEHPNLGPAILCQEDPRDKKTVADGALIISELLTTRELQVASLVAQGYSNKQVAKQLRLSVWTVSTHLRRIFMKLGVDSRAAMVYKCASII